MFNITIDLHFIHSECVLYYSHHYSEYVLYYSLHYSEYVLYYSLHYSEYVLYYFVHYSEYILCNGGWWYSGEDAALLFRGLGFDPLATD